jgi:MerR family copper efflux transcriptional regulator
MGYPMNIGEAAEAAGITAKMIRHYEGLGLIPQAARTDAGYRQYTVREVATLRFIRQARSMGFSMKHIEQLLDLWADTNRKSRDVKALARKHIEELDRKMSEMAQMKAALEPLAAGCQGDHRAECPILSKLSGDAAPMAAGPASNAKARTRTRGAAEAPKTHGQDHASPVPPRY